MMDGRDYFRMKFEDTAQWRRAVAHDHPDDPRNLEAVAMLDRLTQSLDACPDAVVKAAYEVMEDGFTAHEQLSERLRTVGFHAWPGNTEEFLRELISDWSGGGLGGSHRF